MATTDLPRHQNELIDTTSAKLGRAEGVLDIVLGHIDGTWPAPARPGVTVELPASLVDRIRELTDDFGPVVRS